MIYFAYGSNMNPGQMAERSPGARTIGVARLVDYCLCFPRRSESRPGASAGIEPRPGNAVWGVLYDVPEEDMTVLNHHEGFDPSGPAARNRHILREVTVLRLGGSDAVQAMTYFAVPDGTMSPPSLAYMNTVIDGAVHHGLPKAYIAALERVRTT